MSAELNELTEKNMDLNELADRVEGLSGPDRGIDALITIAMDPERQTITGHQPGRFPREPIYGPITEFIEMAEESGKDAADYLCAPAYTASIDAAMTLVPEGWWVRTISGNGATAFMWLLERDAHADAATLPLAITAAALRSKAALNDTSGRKRAMSYIDITRLVEEAPSVAEDEQYYIWCGKERRTIWTGPSRKAGEEWARANRICIEEFEPFEL